MCAPFTAEDAAIIERAANRSKGLSLLILYKMVCDGTADDTIMSDLVYKYAERQFVSFDEYQFYDDYDYYDGPIIGDEGIRTQ